MLRAGMPVGPLIARLDAHTRDHPDPLIASLLADLCFELEPDGRMNGNWWTDGDQHLARWLAAHASVRLGEAVLAMPDHPDALYWLDAVSRATAGADASVPEPD